MLMEAGGKGRGKVEDYRNCYYLMVQGEISVGKDKRGAD